MPERFRVCAVAELTAGSAKEVVVGGRVLALYNVDGQLYALDGICPHAGGPLGAGRLTGSIVTCPWHGWQFDVTTGKHCLTDRIAQQQFPLTIEQDEIYVELP